MKVKHSSRDLLIAEEVPWFMAIMLTFFIFCFVAPGLFLVFEGEWAGLIFAFGGGGLGFMGMCVFVERLQVILDAQEGLITLRRRTILSHKETQLALSELQKAVTETTISGNERRELYRPSLVLENANGRVVHPITQVYSSGSSATRLVAAVNEWLDARTDSGRMSAD